ncbi:flagellar basal body L-ring protein FlgH [Tepidiphilus thermophilus]|uniref:Flagellar L-ring protein n=1 Tax=Tepidiphilus thermophilus TaxID=876478 RepID=A0A0K6IXF5_9PROT|nr:flagellar basal body L-ring protein FlgH [Tepidiphilus thermophilus]CUB07768.1 Flagellar basal body L-ring protein FlgH [Tepidiphilus thermophilus]
MTGRDLPRSACRSWPLLALLALAGCAALDTTPPAIVHQPMTARPAPLPSAPNNGSIYQAGAVRPLFEDRKPRYVGDTLTINLVEETSAKKKTGANARRETASNASIGSMSRLPLSGLAGLGLGAKDDQKLDASGGASADNEFKGTITVTVIDVYPNGNLLVSGEKQLAINQGREYIRFSGVVDPISINGKNNMVDSTSVADARIEYVGSGYIDEAQRMGWLQRFFLNFLPF